MQVVADPSLSTPEKLVAVNSLEQDARQLAIASAEGMHGGEATRLHDIRQAKRCLETPSADTAFSVVLRTLEQHHRENLGTETHVLITRAIEAINAARDAIAARLNAPAVPPGSPRPGSEQELEEEIEKEKLDPGA